MQSAIHWPSHFLPGTTDNFVSNETIAANLSASQIWPLLSDISAWEKYYSHNVSDITPPDDGPHLKQGDTFKFSTFGFPVLECKVEECVAPDDSSSSSSGSKKSTESKAGRIAWSAALEGDENTATEVYHAWLVEDLDGGRVRILTQESQIGKPANELSGVKPNKMLLGHQDWIDGLVAMARGEKVGGRKTNLGSVKWD